MKTVNLVQGTPEWKAHRREHFNASEAAAMLGLDPNTSRNDLLRMKATGNEKEFSDWVQKNVLDYGHEVEALARPIIEELIGEELYPVTGTKGELSASFDGLTMMEDVAFEHKQWNENLAALVRDGNAPASHMPQLQQQIMVSGCEKVIFVVSDGTKEKMVYTEVTRDNSWCDRITNGWEQFKADLKEYEHKEIKEPPKASLIQELPALFVELNGEVKNTNLPAVKDAAQNFIDNIKTDLSTDEDFANAEATVKFCNKAEKQLEETKKAALAQTQSIDEVMNTIDFIKEELRSKRLMLNKLVKQRKEEIKNSIIAESQKKWEVHLFILEDGVRPCKIPVYNPDFHSAVKNKRTLKSIHVAVDTTLANAKIEANKLAKDIGDNLKLYEKKAAGYEFLFNDLSQIVHSPIEVFDALISSRIDEHKKLEQQRLEQQRLEQQRLEQQRLEQQRLEQQRKAEEEEKKKAYPVQQEEPQAEAQPQMSQTTESYKSKLDQWAEKHSVSKQAMIELMKILNLAF